MPSGLKQLRLSFGNCERLTDASLRSIAFPPGVRGGGRVEPWGDLGRRVTQLERIKALIESNKAISTRACRQPRAGSAADPVVRNLAVWRLGALAGGLGQYLLHRGRSIDLHQQGNAWQLNILNPELHGLPWCGG